jgi:peroxiredoxin
VHGGTVDLEHLLADRPAVLLFFRCAGCPACNIALRHYQAELYPALADLGVPLVAISPQVPERAQRDRWARACRRRRQSDQCSWKSKWLQA